jgi:LPS export ABC transporter protein LptC
MSAGVEQKMKDFSVVGFGEDKTKRWELSGTTATVMENNLIALEGIVARTLADAGSVTLTAKAGTFDRAKNMVHLANNVEAVTSDGIHASSDFLDWSGNDGTLKASCEVNVEKDNIEFRGEGVEAQIDLKKIELKRNVVVNIKPKTTVTCSGPLEIDYKENSAVFNENVQVHDERGDMFADRIEALFDPVKKVITRIIADGNVKILKEGNVIYSEHAVYTAEDDRITFTGQSQMFVYPGGKF